MRDVHEIIVENLKGRMKQQRMSRNDLAEKAGISCRQLSNILARLASPKLQTLQNLAAALDITLVQLMTDSFAETQV